MLARGMMLKQYSKVILVVILKEHKLLSRRQGCHRDMSKMTLPRIDFAS